MRIGSGVQSASEVFGKQQNNSKTYVAENEAFSQTSVKVYLKTDDMLFSGGNGTGLSFYIKYAEESTEDNPVVIAKGVDENGKEFEEKYIGQGMNENRTMEETLDLGWKLLGRLPREELDRVDTKILDKYYKPSEEE